MVRIASCVVVVVGAFALLSTQESLGQQQKNQMVKGTIKTVDASKDLLVVNQKVKNESVARELSITKDTAFVITDSTGTKNFSGRDGLAVLEGKEGSQVQVKCDKDVNVLQVKVTIK